MGSLHEWILGKLRKADGQKGQVYLCCSKTHTSGYECTKQKHSNRFATVGRSAFGREVSRERKDMAARRRADRSVLSGKNTVLPGSPGHFVTSVLYGKNVSVRLKFCLLIRVTLKP